MRNILFIAYPLYADFEIAHTLFFLRKVGKVKVITATVDGKHVESVGGLITTPQITLAEAKVEDYDLVLISGGDGIETIINDSLLSGFLQNAHLKGTPIATICAAATLLGKAGLLKGKKLTCTDNTFTHFSEVFEGATYTGNNIEVLDNIITAKDTAFAEFTIAVGDQMKMWKNDAQSSGALRFCKGEI
ncbi:DJ-1/PfpI family protein [Heyndrickxia oleronia]|uniref:DJ-1/PfpI family protein n=1 Tax=Heyndrickxia oleronia TaxID=38875 RepID=UPI003750D951